MRKTFTYLALKAVLFVLVLMGGVRGWGQTSMSWSGASSGAWLSTGNWTGAVVPGSKTTTTNNDIAFFNNAAQPTAGINMGTQAGTHYLGALNFGSSATTARTVNNSSGATSGTLFLNGVTLNSVSNTIIWNQSSAVHTITNGSSAMSVGLNNATDNVIQITGAGGLTIASIITGANKLTKAGSGSGVLLLSAANTYIGATTIFSGTLRLGILNAIPVAATGGGVVLNGGTLSTGATLGFSEGASGTANMGTLTLSDNSTIALGTGNHSLYFAASSGATWTSGKSITISGWGGTAGQTNTTGGKIYIGASSAGLTAGQLAQIAFTGFTNGTTILSTGEVVPKANAAPTASSISISGTTTQGQTLTGSYSYSDAEGDIEATSTFKWYRADDNNGLNEVAIAGAASTIYTLTGTDATKYIRFSVVPVASSGTTTGAETFSSRVGPIVATTPVLAILGTPTNHGSVCPNTAAVSVQYTITNNGTVQADGINVASSDPQFVVTGLSSAIIAPSATATYNVTFTPTSSGAKASTITVSSTTSGSNSPTSSLIGTGAAPVAQAVSSSAATVVTSSTAQLNGNVSTLGVCPATQEKGFVYSQTATNSNPSVGGMGVTQTSVASVTTGVYSLSLSGLPSSTGYSFAAYVYDGTSYTYGNVQTFTTAGALTITGTTSQGATCPDVSKNPISYTITNSGAVQAEGIQVVSNDPQFVVSGLSSSTIAASGGTASYTVTFTPSSGGGKSATITVSSTTSGITSVISSLTGTGTTPVSQALTSSAASSVVNTTATLNGNVGTLGVCPTTIEKGFVYSQTSANADPIFGGTGVTKTSVSSVTTGAYALSLTGLTPAAGYSFKAYVYNGTTYTYGSVTTFTTLSAASQLIFGVQAPSTGNVGVNLTTFTVQAKRPDNTIDAEYTGNITLTRTVVSGSGNIAGTLTLAATAGVASFNAVQFDAAGTFTITAASGSLSSVTSSNIIVTLTPVVLAGWDFFGQSSPVTFAATTFSTNLASPSSLSNITRGSNAVSSSGGNSFRTTGFSNDGISITNADYFQVTLKPTAGKAMSLSTITGSVVGTNTYSASPGVSNQFAYSLDGTSFILIGSPVIVSGTTPATMPSIDLTGVAALQNVSPNTTVTLRYYASGQTTTGGWGFSSATSGTNGLAFSGNILCVQPVANGLVGGGAYCTGGSGVPVGVSTSQVGVSYQLKIDGVNSGSTVAGTGSAISFGNQTAAGTYTVVGSNTNGTCSYTVTMTGSVVVTVNPTSVPGTITGAAPVCSGINSTMLTLGGSTGSIQWQSSTDNVTFTNISGATGSTYTATNLTATTYYEAVITSGNCTAATTPTVVITFNSTGTWTGASTGDWFNTSNWCGGVPNSFTNVVIPSGVTVTIGSATAIANNVTLNGGTLTVSGQTLQVAGNISNSGTLSAATGTIEFNGTSAQTFSNTTTDVTASSLTINNGAGVTLSGMGKVNVKDVLTPTAGILTTGGLLVLKSAASGTARVAEGSGSYISGNVAVERFVPAKAVRKFIFLSSPIAGLIGDTWQQQIHITGSGSGGTICANGSNATQPVPHTDGFDATLTNAPSMIYYDEVGGGWASITGTNINGGLVNRLVPGQGFRINVRGSRSLGCALLYDNPPAPGDVTLSATGPFTSGLNMGTVPVLVANGFTLLGNPYASQINFHNFSLTNGAVINDKYWAYNPENAAGTYSIYDPGGTSINFPGGYDQTTIASGQSFFVQSSTGGSVDFNEAHKAITTQPGFFRVTKFTKYLRIGLKTSNQSHLDEIVIRFGSAGLASYDPSIDAMSLNEGSIYLTSKKGATNLAIQTRSENFVNDTVLVFIKAINGNYLLTFSEFEQMGSNQIFLIDNLLHITRDVRSNTTYPFSVTSDPNSQGSNRFQVVFRSASVLPLDYITLQGQAKNNSIELQWKVGAENNMDSYKVQRSDGGRVFEAIGKVTAISNNSSSVAYTYTDTKPLENTSYYRIQAFDKNGEIKYSPVVKMLIERAAMQITLYPNPVKDILNLVLPISGYFQVSIRNGTGATIWRSSPRVGTSFQINTSHLSSGTYMIEVVDKNGNRTTEKFIKQ